LNTPEGLEFKSGESHPIIVETTTPLSEIPPGSQSVSCTVRIVQPSGVTESDTANNTLAGTVGR
jgi:hypothetical protein